jgi:hypothetical protein
MLDQDIVPERIARDPPAVPSAGEVRPLLAVLNAALEY